MEQALSIQIIPLSNAYDLPLPVHATVDSAGLDLLAAIDTPILLKPFERHLVPCGFCLALPVGYEAQIRSRSGLSLHHGIIVMNAPGTIDADYRGEIKVILINMGTEDFVIERGMRIAQMVIARYQKIEWQTVECFDDRDILHHQGFGSTGLFHSTPKVS